MQTSGFSVSMSQIGKQGSNVDIAIVEIKIAPQIFAINGSAMKNI